MVPIGPCPVGKNVWGGGSESLAEGALCDPAGAPERADPVRIDFWNTGSKTH
jgi:hypothetical protein